MRYDFTSLPDRSGRDALAVDGLGTLPGFSPDKPKDGVDLIPMWVADQNFVVCPAITDAIIERAKHPSFGYFSPREEYYDAIIRWQAARNGVAGLECFRYLEPQRARILFAIEFSYSVSDILQTSLPF